MVGVTPSACLLCVGLLLGAPTKADANPPYELHYDLTLDFTALGYGVVFYATNQLLGGRIAPSACRWCDRTDSGADGLNRVDASLRTSLRWADPDAAGTLSDVGMIAIVPVLALGLNAIASAADGRLGQIPQNALFIAEAMMLTAVVTQVVKLLVARQRPGAHFSQDPTRAPTTADNLSFFSGHASFTMSLAVASGTIASLRGYRWAPLVWALAVPAAMFTGYLRIAADRHYFTDVLAGTLVGGFLGFAIPYFFHGRREEVQREGPRLSFVPAPGGGSANLGWRW